MKVLALCRKSLEQPVRRAAGVQPLTSPPINTATFNPARISGYDLLYLNLHGLADQPYWYGDNWITSCSAGQIRLANLSRTIVFAANCHLADGPMLDALLQAGAQAVVGGPGSNWSGQHAVLGADLLGLWFRRALRLGPKRALSIAKMRLRATRPDPSTEIGMATLDALEFELFT